MKIYRDMKKIIMPKIIAIGLCIMLYPLALEMIKLLNESSSAVVVVFILMIISGAILILYLCYIMLFHSYGIKHHTVEITATGIRYPYLLKEDKEILWQDIKDIEYSVIRISRHWDYNIIVILQDDIDVGEFKSVPELGTLTQLQKRYDTKIVVLFEDIIKGHSLSDLVDQLNAKRKHAIAPPAFINGESIQYRMHGAPTFHVIKTLGLSFATFSLILMSMFILDLQSFYSKMIVLILAVTMSLIVLKFLSGRVTSQVELPIALRFDQDGITVLDDQKFSPSITWADVQYIEIKERIKSALQRSKEPTLFIGVMDKESGEVENYEIKNDLKDTSVYEVMSSLKYYWR